MALNIVWSCCWDWKAVLSSTEDSIECQHGGYVEMLWNCLPFHAMNFKSEQPQGRVSPQNLEQKRLTTVVVKDFYGLCKKCLGAVGKKTVIGRLLLLS
ncbi:hypothetical protein TNIN_271781 [Trichonephila inaurata madagascariensis]|uniref:Uncharacterized protein n=1 Tax=Trichonephila inaurata madagascariensis TaxID=2747483 RepID=A0A8X6XH77_9ARAC|nr:hypothetical protein TNIN_271781 [Trichonephila inaurata madagascariensis]